MQPLSCKKAKSCDTINLNLYYEILPSEEDKAPKAII